MKKLIAMTLLLGGSTLLCAQKTVKIPAVYKPVKSEMYKKGWIDFNKNGVKDVYEDPNASLDARIEDLLSQMTLEEKTCQMVTLYPRSRKLPCHQFPHTTGIRTYLESRTDTPDRINHRTGSPYVGIYQCLRSHPRCRP